MTPSFQDIKSTKIEVLISLITDRAPCPLRRILVVGCGSGHEAGILARKFGAETIGIDLGEEFLFDHIGSYPAKLMQMDAQSLDFADGQFDLVFSFHALEHITDPELALKQMSRVLRPGGFFCIGTPNKSRLIGYVGSATTLGNKIRWNWNDWRMRLAGRWDNAKGAHAGFTAKELLGLCHAVFGEAHDISGDYYKTLYRLPAVRKLIVSPLRTLFLPCVYVVGVRV